MSTAFSACKNHVPAVVKEFSLGTVDIPALREAIVIS
jgi:hypothetical protein